MALEFGKSTAFFKSGEGDLSRPQGLTCTPHGVLLVADTGNSLILKLDKNNVLIHYVGGTGPTNGSLKSPTGICIDANGVLRRKFIGPVDWTKPEIIAYLRSI